MSGAERAGERRSYAMTRLRYLRGDGPIRAAALNNTVRSIRATYETDPAVYAAMLPRPLTALDRPEIFVQLAHVAMHVSPERTIEIGALTMGVMCDYEGQRGAYCFHMAMEGESVVTSGRERFGEPKKIAVTSFEKNGDHVRATCSRHGITYMTIEGDIGASNDGARQFEEYLYCYKALQGIQDPGSFDGDVFLTRLDWKRNYTTRRDMTGTIAMAESAYDPLIDIPVERLVSMEYVEGATVTSGRLLRTVPGEWIADQWVGRFDDPANTGIEIRQLAEQAA
jgi:acetoacetate decarboxylase